VRRLGISLRKSDADGLWWQFELEGPLNTAFIGASDASWQALASELLDAANSNGIGDARQVYLALLAESFESTGTQTDRPPQSRQCEIYEIRFPESEPIRLQFIAEPRVARRSPLGALLNIELPITIRFGWKKMLLQDVVQVNAGATIEFDRRVNDPVEILVNGRAVARGEAVVVRGNYGIRIIEIADRNDWLETSAIVERGSGSRKAE